MQNVKRKILHSNPAATARAPVPIATGFAGGTRHAGVAMRTKHRARLLLYVYFSAPKGVALRRQTL